MIFDAAKNRLGHQRQTKLIVTAGPVVGVVHPPANPPGDKLRPDLVAVWITEHPEQISRLNCNFESRGIERLNLRLFLSRKDRLNPNRHPQNSGAKKFHLARNDRGTRQNFNLGRSPLHEDWPATVCQRCRPTLPGRRGNRTFRERRPQAEWTTNTNKHRASASDMERNSELAEQPADSNSPRRR